MISSTSCGSFFAYTASESPTSNLNPHPVKSSSKWRVSFADSKPLRLRLTRSLAGNGFAREYGGAATEASACIKETTRLYADNLSVRKLISLLFAVVLLGSHSRVPDT